ncbi:unnamed protein product [Heligmosomoides polygyrus]|uniref:Secreted protein n=1 Tax=Heligmosomoides polygyrus TaxID=6339 RepID=A0A183GFX8_HELPZ|nr:unnamed protein product [Heligmosomoides polygyrus]
MCQGVVVLLLWCVLHDWGRHQVVFDSSPPFCWLNFILRHSQLMLKLLLCDLVEDRLWFICSVCWLKFTLRDSQLMFKLLLCDLVEE